MVRGAMVINHTDALKETRATFDRANQALREQFKRVA